ncbi:MAG: bile acid:sodium symporter family protein [Lentisphaerae bacterium]|nr:bile acid:sodium symporter family protein [Lentisphaerota bacterium]
MNTLKFFQNTSRFLANYTSPVIVGVAAITFIWPQLFSWVKGDVQTLVLGIIMLTMGMTLTTDDFKILAKRPWDIFIGSLAQYTLMPLIALSMVKFMNLPPGIAAGLLLVGCCPGGVSSNIITFLSRGDVAFSVGMTTASTLLAPVMTPLLMLYLAGDKIEINAIGMFKSILIVTILPVALGAIGNFFWGKKTAYQEFCKTMPGVSVIAFACIVGGVITFNGKHFFDSGLLIFVAIFLHNAIGYITGYGVGIIARMSKAQKRTISIEVGMQNAGLATNLATHHFAASPEAALASAVSCVWHSISGTLLAGIFRLIDRRKEQQK